MNREEFITLIESIGFKSKVFNIFLDHYYFYKGFKLYLYDTYYQFSNGSEWFYDILYTDLTPIKKHFKQELRSIKLKELLRWV